MKKLLLAALVAVSGSAVAAPISWNVSFEIYRLAAPSPTNINGTVTFDTDSVEPFEWDINHEWWHAPSITTTAFDNFGNSTDISFWVEMSMSVHENMNPVLNFDRIAEAAVFELSSGDVGHLISISRVPEPTTVTLLSLGLAGICFTRRR